MRPAAQRVVAPSVHELEQLDGELDVSQPAGAELELAVGVARRDRRLDPAPHRLDVGDEARTGGGRPHERFDGVDELGPSSRSPAIGLALSSAWNSQVFAQRW